MKKIYLSILASAFAMTVNAQLTLTKAFNEPVVGNVNTQKGYDSTGVIPKATGAGQNWNFSTLTTNTTPNDKTPFMHPFGFQDMPMHNFGRDSDRGFSRGFGPGGFGMHGGMGFFAPLMFLGRILFWGLVIWFAYWLFTKSGWKLSRTPQPVESPKVEVPAPTEKEA